MYLTSVYGDPECQMSCFLNQIGVISENCYYILGGSFNARNKILGEQITNSIGNLVQEFIHSEKLALVNQYGLPTFFTTKSGKVIQSIIDLTLDTSFCFQNFLIGKSIPTLSYIHLIMIRSYSHFI